jgi:hypothetical protein
MRSGEEATFDGTRVEGVGSRRSGDRDCGTESGSSEVSGDTAAANLRATSEIGHICIAADLLRQIMMELQRVELNNAYSVPAIAAARQDMRGRLNLLLATIESLVAAENPTRVIELGRRAKQMIYRLAGEIDQWAIQARGAGDLLTANSS